MRCSHERNKLLVLLISFHFKRACRAGGRTRRSYAACDFGFNQVKAKQLKARKDSHTIRRQQEKEAASELKDKLPVNLQRAVTVSVEKGASSWLSTLPIDEHGFALHKGAFRDALCLRYGWRPPHLSSHCVCGEKFTVGHALNCPRGGYPSIRVRSVNDPPA